MLNRPDKNEMMSWIERFTQWPHRMTGTPEGKASAQYVADTFRGLGLEEVAIEPVPSVCHFVSDCLLTVTGDSCGTAAEDIECFFINGTNRVAETGSTSADIKDAELIYLGRGTESDFQNADVRGKIVICDCYFKSHSNKAYLKAFQDPYVYDPEDWLDKERNIYNIFSPNDWPFNYLRAFAEGAAGFVGILRNFMDCHYYHEDYKEIMDLDDYMQMAGVWVSKDDGDRLIEAAQKGATGSLRINTSYEYRDALNVKGLLRGQSDNVLLIHSHHDATCRGAVQDASGMSVVFALAKHFMSVPEEQRKTNIMFLATDSHYTDYEGHVGFLDAREADGTNLIVDLAVEHIGKAMEMDDDNQIVLEDASEARQIYVSNIKGLPQAIYSLVEKHKLNRMMVLPVGQTEGGEYKSGDVNSDAYDFSARGIPVISLISAPMYIYHNSDDVDKVHQDSLEPVANMFIDTVQTVWNTFD